MTKHYKEVKAKADFVEIEKEVLKFWDEDKTFENPFTIATVPPNSFLRRSSVCQRYAALRTYYGFLR